MMKLKAVMTLGLALMAAYTTQAVAHHSFAVHFVADKLVKVEGEVTDFKFRNPHGVLTFQVKQPDGSMAEWRAETNSPNVLRRRGWSPNSLKAGESVTVEGYPARDGTNYMRIFQVVKTDGTTLTAQRPEVGLAPAEDGSYSD
ncbi:MAG: hypothetical protein H6978_14860 [Gammaproteobacteria bacterium]|nr:hypothetical protein [Gammaproteobacteria bacterium]